jgi:hypothetical protein
MNLKRRRGFALIWVVLIGALIFVGIVSLTLRIVPENMITIARTHTQRALSVAEDGTSKVLFDLRNFGTSTDPNYTSKFDPNSGSSHYLTQGNVITLINSSSGTTVPATNPPSYVTNLSPPSDESFETSYKAKIKVISNDTTNKILKVDLYTLGTVKDRANGNVLARKAIKTNFEIEYSISKKWVKEPLSEVANYALFSGNSISFSGNAQTVNGDIHAIGLIDLGKANQVRVENGNAETEDGFVVYEHGQGGTVDGGKLDTTTSPPAPKITFPIINIDTYTNLANALRAGTPPYDGQPVKDENGVPILDKDGHEIYFANTSNDIVKLAIRSYLGAPGTSSTLDGINNFYHDLINGTGELTPHPGGLTIAQLENLQAYMGSIVYYVQGPVTINAQFACAGTLVVDGDLSINGGATVGDPNNPGASAILVKGNIIRSNGNADLYGLFYSTGSVKGVGTFDCEGSVITQGSMDLKGTYTVKYVPLTWNPNAGPNEGHYETTGSSITSAASGSNSSYSWKEISYEAFNAGN